MRFITSSGSESRTFFWLQSLQSLGGLHTGRGGSGSSAGVGSGSGCALAGPAKPRRAKRRSVRAILRRRVRLSRSMAAPFCCCLQRLGVMVASVLSITRLLQAEEDIRLGLYTNLALGSPLVPWRGAFLDLGAHQDR
jgi:hypothetical protein